MLSSVGEGEENPQPRVEVIRFENPRPEARLFVPEISWGGSKEELNELLRDKFGQFGLIHSLYVERSRRPQQQDSSNCWFALVDFYSVEASTQARASLDQTDLVPADSTGFPRPSRVLKSKRENRTDLPLSASRCEQLANYYLGFNGWSSQTLYHRRESRTVENGSAIEKFCSAVRITFSCSPHLSSEGAGVAEAKYSSEDPEEKCRALGAARKSSRVMAQRNAFAKVLLVILPEKKSVCVEIDSTAVDPFYYNAVWEDEQSVVVNEVNTAQYESDEA